jgi:DNA-binding XRE family transcriptional regulator
MKNASFNYVRTFRKRHALSEEELAFLVDQRAQSAVAQFESGDRVPNLQCALALQVLFRQPPHQMFPDAYEWVEDGVMRRAAVLIEKLRTATDRNSVAKREFLEGLAREEFSDDGV